MDAIHPVSLRNSKRHPLLHSERNLSRRAVSPSISRSFFQHSNGSFPLFQNHRKSLPSAIYKSVDPYVDANPLDPLAAAKASFADFPEQDDSQSSTSPLSSKYHTKKNKQIFVEDSRRGGAASNAAAIAAKKSGYYERTSTRKRSLTVPTPRTSFPHHPRSRRFSLKNAAIATSYHKFKPLSSNSLSSSGMHFSASKQAFNSPLLQTFSPSPSVSPFSNPAVEKLKTSASKQAAEAQSLREFDFFTPTPEPSDKNLEKLKNGASKQASESQSLKNMESLSLARSSPILTSEKLKNGASKQAIESPPFRASEPLPSSNIIPNPAMERLKNGASKLAIESQPFKSAEPLSSAIPLPNPMSEKMRNGASKQAIMAQSSKINPLPPLTASISDPSFEKLKNTASKQAIESQSLMNSGPELLEPSISDPMLEKMKTDAGKQTVESLSLKSSDATIPKPSVSDLGVEKLKNDASKCAVESQSLMINDPSVSSTSFYNPNMEKLKNGAIKQAIEHQALNAAILNKTQLPYFHQSSSELPISASKRAALSQQTESASKSSSNISEMCDSHPPSNFSISASQQASKDRFSEATSSIDLDLSPGRSLSLASSKLSVKEAGARVYNRSVATPVMTPSNPFEISKSASQLASIAQVPVSEPAKTSEVNLKKSLSLASSKLSFQEAGTSLKEKTANVQHSPEVLNDRSLASLSASRHADAISSKSKQHTEIAQPAFNTTGTVLMKTKSNLSDSALSTPQHSDSVLFDITSKAARLASTCAKTDLHRKPRRKHKSFTLENYFGHNAEDESPQSDEVESQTPPSGYSENDIGGTDIYPFALQGAALAAAKDFSRREASLSDSQSAASMDMLPMKKKLSHSSASSTRSIKSLLTNANQKHIHSSINETDDIPTMAAHIVATGQKNKEKAPSFSNDQALDHLLGSAHKRIPSNKTEWSSSSLHIPSHNSFSDIHHRKIAAHAAAITAASEKLTPSIEETSYSSSKAHDASLSAATLVANKDKLIHAPTPQVLAPVLPKVSLPHRHSVSLGQIRGESEVEGDVFYDAPSDKEDLGSSNAPLDVPHGANRSSMDEVNGSKYDYSDGILDGSGQYTDSDMSDDENSLKDSQSSVLSFSAVPTKVLKFKLRDVLGSEYSPSPQLLASSSDVSGSSSAVRAAMKADKIFPAVHENPPPLKTKQSIAKPSPHTLRVPQKKHKHFYHRDDGKYKSGTNLRKSETVDLPQFFIDENRRKLYEGLWAANKGYLLSKSEYSKPNDLICNIVVRELWSRSGAPTSVLAKIYDLVDRHHTGVLGRDEFIVGMFLIDQYLKGRKLPLKVPDSVWLSSKRMGDMLWRLEKLQKKTDNKKPFFKKKKKKRKHLKKFFDFNTTAKVNEGAMTD
ncbi:autophagy/CVT pathway ENTH/VHS domain protein Irs4 [Schizosaccharomyces pombe]|uniref:Increased rDNA silencing protein 4 homolog n=1 Tax=Schizosaccharomyces pombe (strain 972 / ATCC 24843) TaxID=284812 RepID=IRS4_SCHPO|nr:putative ENTH/VHS domain protein [Schizosaccharomyces pombe]O14066.2 RecName: Full=Increased rDNA silencing protein 4 homolog [Schizosaccharomyces pombe 972h-]CAA22603.1 ENTH/VHS domain protein (predicted) [Schizosaccharomyces pombe]|eukprot:NP_593127.1 putative ENTH/VHS domain protein [Schizosaccharomyces pombe]